MKVISNVLLDKDRPNLTGKLRLYCIQSYNDLETYLTGLSIQDCIDRNEFKYKIKKFHTIDSWKDLLQKQTVISTEIDQYNRKCITLTNFCGYYDDYANNYYIVNDSTRETITLK